MTRKILYGVQGTGQGHISRARGVAHALQNFDIDVTWLFSGRERDKLFDMEIFGDFKYREGLTMVTESGKMRYRKTALGMHPATFIKDATKLDLDPYDLIIVDRDGTIAIEWGAYGVPETFLIYDKKIVKKIIGPLNDNLFFEIKDLIK